MAPLSCRFDLLSPPVFITRNVMSVTSVNYSKWPKSAYIGRVVNYVNTVKTKVNKPHDSRSVSAVELSPSPSSTPATDLLSPPASQSTQQ